MCLKSGNLINVAAPKTHVVMYLPAMPFNLFSFMFVRLHEYYCRMVFVHWNNGSLIKFRLEKFLQVEAVGRFVQILFLKIWCWFDRFDICVIQVIFPNSISSSIDY